MTYTPEQILSWARSAPLTPTRYVTTRRQRLALLVLASFGPDERGRIRGSRVEALRLAMYLDETAVSRCLAQLEASGLVVVERTGNGHHLGYRLTGLPVPFSVTSRAS